MHDHAVHQAHTQHTCERVPFLYIGQRSVQISDNGTLADVAPSMLALMGLQQPKEMSGRNLLTIL
jgi:2,3-bisphosphoglycerate-independent phosphoglycerate mutase